MVRVKWETRIAIDPEVHHGDPCIKGTCILAFVIIGSLADGMSPQEIIQEYPQLTEEDVYAVLAYATNA